MHEAATAAAVWLLIIIMICIAYARFMNRIDPRD